MAEAGIRVALLAKAGESRNQLRTALQELGADLVCEGDPAELTPSAVSGLNPRVMVVSLEPATEAALDKFEDLLSHANIEVVYDDAEASGQLNGWDLNRWARHLAAKIIGTDIMPPVPVGSAMASQDEWQPQPGAPETPAQAMDAAKLEDYLHETQALATDVPVNESYSDALQREVPEALTEPVLEESLDFNLDDLEQAMRLGMPDEQRDQLLESKVEREDNTAPAQDIDLESFESFAGSMETVAPSNEISFDPSHAEIKDELTLADDAAFDIDLSALESSQVASSQTSALDFEENASTLADFEVDDKPVTFSSYQSEEAIETTFSIDDDVAALSAQLDEFEKNDNRAVARNMEFSDIQEKAPPPAPASSVEPALSLGKSGPTQAPEAPPAKAAPKFDLSSLSLVDLDADIPVSKVAPPVAASAPAFKKSTLSLETLDGETPAVKPLSNLGAVLVLAGMGGPDAVRQLLKALPASLNVPVLLYQHLEVGKHDRLVAQLQKVSNLPIYLAVQGQTAEPGQVAVLPMGVGLDLVGDELFFGGAESQQALVESLPAKHSVVIVLSGAASETAAAAIGVQSQGGLALAQDPANCYEPAAAQTLVKQGGKTADIPALAALVLEYFKK